MTTLKGAIEFVFDCRKTVETILYVVDEMGGEVNQYNLLQVIFAAEKYHLNKYGRIVTGSKYQCLPFGPISITIYEMLNGKHLEYYLNELEIDKLPFGVDPVGRNFIVHADRKGDTYFLSQTDVEALNHSIAEYGQLSFQEAQKRSRQERCWRETEEGETVPFELMIDDKEVLEDLLETPFGIGV